MNLVGTMLGVHRFVLIGLCSGATTACPSRSRTPAWSAS